ncbi:MAG: M23 family metallopeptidase [Chthoniobacterales bacterium]
MPGKKERSWSAIGLVVSAVLLAGACVFLALQPRPPKGNPDPRFWPVDAVTLATLPLATRFDMPLGSEHGALVYNAQPFTENRHLGDDLNGIGGENTDFGDPVYAIANGRVIYTGWPADGWGNLILVMHAYEENGRRRYVQSCYAHLNTMEVHPGELVRRGQKIATVGTAGGHYLAHLHFELREFMTPFIGPGYRADARGWLDPSEFVRQHRGAAESDLRTEPTIGP